VGVVGALFMVPALTDTLAQPSWEIGLKAGVGTTKLSGDDVKNFSVFVDTDNFLEGDIGDMRLGFVGGGYGTMHVNDQFGVRLEALYFQKGGKGNITGEVAGIPFTGDLTFKVDYFEVPLLAVFSFPAGTSGTFDVFAGPALGFNLSGEMETEITVAGETQAETSDLEDIKSTDFGGVLGAGFTFSLTSVDLFFDARWEYGFTKIVDAEDDVDVKNNAFGFMAGVGFPLGGKGVTATGTTP
jgi:hypothetical protein